MASVAPSRFNNYTITPDTELTSDTWNACFNDISLRQAAIEVKGASFDTLINEGIGVALDRINVALTPAVTQVETLVAQANATLAQLEGGNIAATLITQDSVHQFVTTDMIKSLTLIRSRVFYLSTM